ncbi:hypothetical protein HALLA_05925 [Halostagnicola larsenii XH-48]|uniref:Uncharacterized protein n=1 Tax=Halostagnicola larsenii XH-48 TaxID=797299 RepID=W0JUM8_9EURY|nr:hypothetical protein HALLA_05925 [Halostagnicola larsenii XH-48]
MVFPSSERKRSAHILVRGLSISHQKMFKGDAQTFVERPVRHLPAVSQSLNKPVGSSMARMLVHRVLTPMQTIGRV